METEKRLVWLFIRYAFILLASLGSLFVFYELFTPLTIYPVAFLLGLVYPTLAIVGRTLFIEGAQIVIIDACIAGSAYYLLFILGMVTPMKPKIRLYSLVFAGLVFLGVNIIRIFIFSLLALNSFTYFDITHMLFWYVISSLLVVAIWILTIKLFKIESIPFYSDLQSLYSLTKPAKKPSKLRRVAKNAKKKKR